MQALSGSVKIDLSLLVIAGAATYLLASTMATGDALTYYHSADALIIKPQDYLGQRIRVGGNVQSARLVQQPKPLYPPEAKQARIQGVVQLSTVIGRDGTVQQLEVISGHPLLVPSALEAVKQWVYQPTLLNGNPVEVVTQIDVNYTLSQ